MRRYTLLLLVLSLFAAPVNAQPSVTVAAAISLKESLTQIARDYQTETGQTVQLSFGSSGALAAQIIQGAPVDLFVSAGDREMDEIARAGLIVDDSRRTLCENGLVLIVPAGASRPPGSFSDLLNPSVQHIAIGQPKVVPAGMYAMEVLDNLKLADALKDKLVMGENVRQVLDYVIRGEVDAGIVYSTDALIGGDRIRVVAQADPKLHQPIEYPAAIVSTRQLAQSQRFLDYFEAPKSQQILASHGFVIASQPTTRPTTIPSP